MPRTPQPETRDLLAAGASAAVLGLLKTALLARTAGGLARRCHQHFGTPYAPLDPREALLLAFLARRAYGLLAPVRLGGGMDGFSPASFAQRRAAAKRRDQARHPAARLSEDVQPTLNFTETSDVDPAAMTRRLREEREAVRKMRR